MRGDRTIPCPRADADPDSEDAVAVAAADLAVDDRDPEDAVAARAADSAAADPAGPGAACTASAVFGISAKARVRVAAQTMPSRPSTKIIERGVPRTPSPHSQNSPRLRR
nr:hypothetical protein GCM10010200_058140 [Actinomadura rugatobispora]